MCLPGDKAALGGRGWGSGGGDGTGRREPIRDEMSTLHPFAEVPGPGGEMPERCGGMACRKSRYGQHWEEPWVVQGGKNLPEKHTAEHPAALTRCLS